MPFKKSIGLFPDTARTLVDQRVSRFEQDRFPLKATSDWILPVGHIQPPAGVFKTCPVAFSVTAVLPKMDLPVFSGNPSTQTSIPTRNESAFHPLSSRNFGLFACTSQFVVVPCLSVTSKHHAQARAAVTTMRAHDKGCRESCLATDGLITERLRPRRSREFQHHSNGHSFMSADLKPGASSDLKCHSRISRFGHIIQRDHLPGKFSSDT